MSLERTILHVDMDAFYASVEQRDDPSLRGRPVIVGGRSRRGVVAAASYEVRRFGVRSAMSMVEALGRCPHAVVVPPRMSRYVEVSRAIFDIFRRFTPLVEGLSLDEAFLDVTGSRRLFGDGVTIARQIRRAIREEQSLTASAGIAPNKFLAKIASDLDKPDGLVVVAPESVREFLAPLAIERMWGIGKKSAPALHAADFHTIGDLADRPPGALERVLGPERALQVRQLARGIDRREVIVARAPKSVGGEETFERDLTTREAIADILLHQCGRVAARLFRQGLWAEVVVVKIKYGDHQTITRRRTLPAAVADTDTLFEVALELLAEIPRISRGVRLAGVSATGLTDRPPAPQLFGDEERDKRQRIEELTQGLRDRFGSAGLTRARLLGGHARTGPGGPTSSSNGDDDP